MLSKGDMAYLVLKVSGEHVGCWDSVKMYYAFFESQVRVKY